MFEIEYIYCRFIDICIAILYKMANNDQINGIYMYKMANNGQINGQFIYIYIMANDIYICHSYIYNGKYILHYI